MPFDVTANYERHRIVNPSHCIPGTFRTHDIGRPGFSKRIACKCRHSGRWITQALLISHGETVEMKKKLRKQASQLKSRMKKQMRG